MEKRLNHALCGVLTLNKQAEIIDVNETFCTWLGMTKENLIGKHIETLLSSANRLIFHSYFYPTIQLKNEVEGLFLQMTTALQTKLSLLMNAKRFVEEDDEVIDCFLMSMQKRIDYELELKQAKQLTEQAYLQKEQALTELQSLHDEIEKKQLELMNTNAQLLEISNTDKLTNVANRRLFQQQLDTYMERFHCC